MLTVCWSDGASCLPMDFALLSSADAKNRLFESRKSMDRRCCAWQHRKEATVKATKHLDEMVKRILSAGVQAKYLLMDSWFTIPATVTALSTHIDVIGMVKKTPNVLYRYNGHRMDLKAVYRKLKKRCGRASILASMIVTLKEGLCVKLVFVRDRRKKDWLALISTDLELANEEIVRIYGKRWDIGVSRKGRVIQSVKIRPRLTDSRPRSLEGTLARKQGGKALRHHSLKGGCATYQVVTYSERRCSLVTRNPVAETVYNARRQQETTVMGHIRCFSPAGCQRRHGTKDYAETGEALDARRRNLEEEFRPITLMGKWQEWRRGGGSGYSTVDLRAAKHAGREGPGPVDIPFWQSKARV